ncbi:MAG TPA: helix-turn-helix domain-containing protein [Pyrinomonadaceae bacterium]
MQTLQRRFDDDRKDCDRIKLAKSEVLKTVAYALLREVYGVRQPQKPDLDQRINFFEEVRRFEISLIMQALLYSNGSKAAAGRLLNLNAPTLHFKIKLYSLETSIETIAGGNRKEETLDRKRGETCITNSADVVSIKQSKLDEYFCNDTDAVPDLEIIKTEVMRSIARILDFNANNYLSVLDFNGKRGVNFYDEVMKFEMELLRQALGRVGGNQRAAARLLSMKTTTLNSKVKLYRLNVDFIAA